MKTIDEERDLFVPEEHVPEIAEVAYSYWESHGRDDGHDVDDWLAAEQEVKRRHSIWRREHQAAA